MMMELWIYIAGLACVFILFANNCIAERDYDYIDNRGKNGEKKSSIENATLEVKNDTKNRNEKSRSMEKLNQEILENVTIARNKSKEETMETILKNRSHQISLLGRPHAEEKISKMGQNSSKESIDETIVRGAAISSSPFHNSELNSTSNGGTEETRTDCNDFNSKNESEDQDVNEFCYKPSDSLKCYQDPIFCETFHLSGKRELKWPAYGEYSYLPHKHWVKVLQNGGVVFLYHPCAKNASISELRGLADSCMHRYVLTQYDKLSPAKPLALVSWGCFLLMRHVNFTQSKNWIKSHAYKGPASHIHKNGTYEHKLVRPAKVITDVKDTLLCPDEEEKASLLSTMATTVVKIPKHKILTHKHVGEEIILKRLEKAKRKTVSHSTRQTYASVDTKKSLAAFGSLVFLFVLLVVLLLYTRLWRPKFPSKRSTYVKLGDLNAESEEQYYESNFSLLKTGQDFISSFKRSRRDKKQDSYTRVRLLAPISEDDDEMENY